jgi:hypothetical protein
MRWHAPLRTALLLASTLAASCRGPAAADHPARIRLASPPGEPTLMFLSVASDDTFKHVLISSLAAPSTGAFITPLVCERVYFAGRRGLCLTEGTKADAPVAIWAQVFDERFERRQRFPLAGLPSRLRVSPDGHRAAATLFASGHSYDEHGFATTTTILDLEAGTIAVPNLEQFSVTRDSSPFHAVDFNFWGVTFARDSDTFYATLSSGRRQYLIKGSASSKEARVIHEGVECPSLSPDNTRIAFKKRIGGSGGWWQLTLLDLDTLTEKPLWNESRSVDDQVEWLDDQHVMYHLTGGSTAADIWSASVDGETPPALVVPDAYSPAVLRTTQVVMQR